MRVLIVGCGYVGVRLGAQLVRQGHSVWGLCRSGRSDAELQRSGIVPLRTDITAPGSFPGLGPGYEWVVHCVSASGGAAPEYEQVYLEGTRHLMSWLSSAPPAKFVYTSSTSVYGQTDGSWVDETSVVAPESPTGRILVQTEELLLEAASKTRFPAIVLRVAGIYGPGRAYWLEQVRAGAARIEGAGQRVLNMIHCEDVAGAILAALAQGRPGRIYNAVDDEPVTQMALVQWLCHRLHCPLPAATTGEPGRARRRGVTNKKVSNRRLREELGYRLNFPSFREGCEVILNS
jgi:nucleoside-diphosphate-sugar epimerase